LTEMVTISMWKRLRDISSLHAFRWDTPA
jgi:hypothetical protein